MRIEDLQTLLNIQRYGSINKAAQNTFLSHSSLIYVLQSVEKELGFPVFNRSQQGVTPTAQGEQFLIDAQAVLDVMNKWMVQPKREKNPAGDVHVTLIPALAQLLAMDVLVQLREDYPNLNVHLTEQKNFTTLELLAALKKKSSRIFVGTLAPVERSLFEEELAQQRYWSYSWRDIDNLALHISAANPLASRESLTEQELASLPKLFYPDSGRKFGFTDVIRHFPVRQVYSISMSDSVLALTASDSAVVLASKLISRSNPFVKNGSVKTVPIEGHPMPMSYYLVYPSSPTRSEQAVISRIMATFDKLTGL